jgi:hypothetical protein
MGTNCSRIVSDLFLYSHEGYNIVATQDKKWWGKAWRSQRDNQTPKEKGNTIKIKVKKTLHIKLKIKQH